MRLLLSAAAVAAWATMDAQAFVPAPLVVQRHGPMRDAVAATAVSSQAKHAFGVSRASGRGTSSLCLAADDEDDEDLDDDDDDEDFDEDIEEPLGKGIDSVAWLPSVIGAKSETISGIKEGAEILPLFPLGGFVYTPNTEHMLNIFEPRYRQMYNDILMNGTKRFVVATSHPTEKGRFAQTGVLFELEDLKEVSEQTGDQIKYICNHKVTGRVTISKVLNPEAWESQKTYLKVEGVIHDDSGKKASEKASNDVYGAIMSASKSTRKEENALQASFFILVKMQHELEEDVRFTLGSVNSLAVKDGSGQDGLWQTVRLWQSFADQRLMARQNELQRDFQEKLQEFLKKEKGVDDDEMPSTVGFQDLSPALQQEVKELQKRMVVELQPLVLESSLTMQKILEAPDHKSRCKLLKFFIDAERKRLDTKKSLKGIFSIGKSGPDKLDSAGMPPEEMIAGDNEKKDGKPGKSESKSILFDEPDAFQ